MSISGVCAVFAESEVINQLSEGAAPADIMHGAIVSLVDRSVQLMKRVRMEPEFTLVGGILRFERMIRVVENALGTSVNVLPGDLVQYTSAFGAALLGQRRLRRLAERRHRACRLTAGSGASSRIRTAPGKRSSCTVRPGSRCGWSRASRKVCARNADRAGS